MLSIDELYSNTIQYEREALERIAAHGTSEDQILSDKRMLWHYNQTFALHALFSKRDIAECKRFFYTCGRIDEYLIKCYDERVLDAGISHISYAVLSEASDLIARYADLAHSKYMWMVEHGHSTLIYAIQQVIKKDWQKLKWALEIIATKNQALKKVLLPDRMFFEGLLEKDPNKITDAIQALLRVHNKRNKHMGIAQNYISTPALCYAKLAWLNGIEVGIKHKLLPGELLPLKPLDNYETNYTFLTSPC